MKNTFLKTISGAALAIFMLAMFAQVQVSAQILEEVPPGQTRDLAGAWRTAVTLRNCQTGLPVSPVGRGLITFHEGGTLSEFNLGPGQNRSPGHGVWEQRRGRRNFSGVFVINRYDATGVFIGTQKVRAAWELSTSGNGYTSNASFEIFDANDNLIGTGCATSVGTRIE